jgi:PHD/YefM family antitoxin component YafN of YafNO toxin-antitoxin module
MDQRNALTSAELKRRGIAAIEQALHHGPVHLLKRNRSAAVVLSEQHYRQLQLQASRAPGAEASALQWLLALQSWRLSATGDCLPGCQRPDLTGGW